MSEVGGACEQVESLEDMSERSRAGSRCFERILMCKPYSIWFQSPGREWHAKLKYGTLGQEVCAAILPSLLLPLLLSVIYLLLPLLSLLSATQTFMRWPTTELSSSCQARTF